MFELLEITIGLFFVYLLLSLVCTAVNEYIAALTNMRGKQLAKGIVRLLDDVEISPRKVRPPDDGQSAPATPATDGAAGDTAEVSRAFFRHPLIKGLFPERNRLGQLLMSNRRFPSYIPARTFAQALLAELGYTDADATNPQNQTGRRQALVDLFDILKRESSSDVVERLGGVDELKGLLNNAALPDSVKLQLIGAVSGTQDRLQKLHDSVEVWFNNAMDRVSGAYKRYTQLMLLIIGVVVSLLFNADTIQIWRTLASNDDLRRAVAEQAAASMGVLAQEVDRVRQSGQGATPPASQEAIPSAGQDTTAGGARPNPDSASAAAGQDTASSAQADSAYALLVRSLARLDSTQLRLGWTEEEAMRLGVLREDGKDPDGKLLYAGAALKDWHWRSVLQKLLGLMLTAMALSLGAPFWFDMLNKVISIRAAGRSPTERAKSPEGQPKRLAESTPR